MDEKVECCAKCKNLYLVEEKGDIICKKCYTLNNVEVFNTIEEYLNNYGMIWNLA